mgnify:CR=1 FL=1
MRLLEGARAGNSAFRQQARKRADHRGFQRFRRAERREKAGHTGRQHGFPRARSARHQQVMPPRRRQLKRAFRPCLAFHLPQVSPARALHHLASLSAREQFAAADMINRPCNRIGCVDLRCADPGSLRADFRRAEHRQPFLRGDHCAR